LGIGRNWLDENDDRERLWPGACWEIPLEEVRESCEKGVEFPAGNDAISLGAGVLDGDVLLGVRNAV
jgi:hypothetical protein